MNSQKGNEPIITAQPVPSQSLTNSWLEISKSAIEHNIDRYRNLIGSSSVLAVVIKGNGYGHGLLLMAQLCDADDNVNWLCVAHLSEGIFLRNNGITKPILVFGYADTPIERAIGLGIDLMVDNLDYAKKINDIGARTGYSFSVHVKIDTGLSRLGIFPHEALGFIRQLQQLPFIIVNGIYSHCAASDTDYEFTKQQLALFTEMIDTLFDNTIVIPFIHMSNSAAIKRMTYYPYFNFFRAGLGIYGFSPFEPLLRTALTWKTRVVAIKTVPAHSYVSYAFGHKTTRMTRVALLPIGYSDGYDIRFSNVTSVYSNGYYAPVLGRVAMNMTMVDVTDADVHVGDEIVLMGDYQSIRLHDLAQQANIINVREILTGIHLQAQRVLIK